MTDIQKLQDRFEKLEKERFKLLENITDLLLEQGYQEEVAKMANALSVDNRWYSLVSLKLLKARKNA
jgi:hypothetical protein